jgi:hypothetical protein
MTEDSRYFSKEDDSEWYFRGPGALTDFPFNEWISKLPQNTDECLAEALLERAQLIDALPISKWPDGPNRKQIDLLAYILLLRAFEGPKGYPPVPVMRLLVHRLLARHGIGEEQLLDLQAGEKMWLELRTSLDPKDVPDRLLEAYFLEHKSIMYRGLRPSVNYIAKTVGASRDTIRRWRNEPIYLEMIAVSEKLRALWEQRQHNRDS